MRDIGKNIRAARVRRGLTQEELAERLHVSRQTVSNYETGRSRPDVEMLLRAAEQLGVDVQVLLYGEPLRPERRREICRLLAEGTALLVLGSGIFLLRRWAGRFLRRAFTVAPLYLTQSTAVPAFYTLLGWGVLRACGIFLGARPLAERRARPLRRAVLIFLAVWAALAAPMVVWNICQTVHTLLRGPGSSLGWNVNSPRWWERAGIWQLYVIERFPAVFALFGASLWSTRPGRRENP